MWKRQCGYAEFCFYCSTWSLDSSAWEDHCKTHINEGQVPFRYDPVRLRSAVACAGYCPVCVWRSTNLPASKMLKQFADKGVWNRHTSSCINNFIGGQMDPEALICPDKRCPMPFSSAKKLLHHLQDVHSIPVPADTVLAKLEAERRDRKPQHHFGA